MWAVLKLVRDLAGFASLGRWARKLGDLARRAARRGMAVEGPWERSASCPQPACAPAAPRAVQDAQQPGASSSTAALTSEGPFVTSRLTVRGPRHLVHVPCERSENAAVANGRPCSPVTCLTRRIVSRYDEATVCWRAKNRAKQPSVAITKASQPVAIRWGGDLCKDARESSFRACKELGLAV